MSPRRSLPTALLAALILAAPAQARPLPADPPTVMAHPRAEVRHGFPWADAVAAVGVIAVGATIVGRRRRVAT